MKKMEEIFNNYLESKDAIEKLVREIWNYIYDNYKDYLEYKSYSGFDDWDLDNNYLSIKYYRRCYDLIDTTWIDDIPLYTIYNNTWKEFVDKIFKQKIEEEEREKESEKNERKKLYEKLKQEFEDEN